MGFLSTNEVFCQPTGFFAKQHGFFIDQWGFYQPIRFFSNQCGFYQPMRFFAKQRSFLSSNGARPIVVVKDSIYFPRNL
jgi:hypothetical protein